METFNILDAPLCSKCNEHSYNQVITEEFDSLCPNCADQQTCYDCGKTSNKVKPYVEDDDLLLICPDCKHSRELENPPTVDMVKFAHEYFGYVKS